MRIAEYEIIKQREIYFCPLHPDPDQAESAVPLLGDVGGVKQTRKASQHCVEVAYDLHIITLRILEEALIELGFHLDNSLLIKLKRALFHYSEETQRVNLGYHQDINSTRNIFVNRYRQLPHGCRDGRPSHWREYR
jgi:hypothetical protein